LRQLGVRGGAGHETDPNKKSADVHHYFYYGRFTPGGFYFEQNSTNIMGYQQWLQSPNEQEPAVFRDRPVPAQSFQWFA
tara:strand:+ start:27 stop:263 length:237 start_codon:yes stop_codon:yes gene_type:complete